MTHKQTHDKPESCDSKESDGNDQSNDNDAPLNRRGYLRLSATAISAISATGVVSADASGSDGAETVTRDNTLTKDEALPESEPPEPTTLTIVGIGEAACYRFTVDGEIVATDEEASVSGSSAEDAIASNTASYEFIGQLTAFSLTGAAAVYLDERQVDPDALVSDEDPVLSNSFVVEGDGTTGDYQFEVDGTVHPAPDLGPVEADDEVTNGSVTGSVTDGKDGYRFDGNLTKLRTRGTADRQINDD